jgi:hypothetical protein
MNVFIISCIVLLLPVLPAAVGIQMLRNQSAVKSKAIYTNGKIVDREIATLSGQKPKGKNPAFVQVAFMHEDKEQLAWCQTTRQAAEQEELEFYYLPEKPDEVFPKEGEVDLHRRNAMLLLTSSAAAFMAMLALVLAHMILTA